MSTGLETSMEDLLSQHTGACTERFEVANPPSYGEAAIHSAVPATKEEWADLLRNNTSCLKGIVVSRQAGVTELAQFTAFKFNYEPTKGPNYVQDEKTEIEVTRIESENQQQSIHVGISQQEIELLMKTAAADSRLDFRNRHVSLQKHKQSSKIKKLEVSHRHPKFILFLDQRSLAITKECQARLLQLKNTADKRQVVAFLEDYGEGFAMQATVGGRLFYSENVSMLEGDALDQRENTLKVAAKASLTSKSSFSKAASITSETEMRHKDHMKTSSISEGMFWCGVGGDPCLHGDPGAWMLSMKEDKSRWKIIEKRLLVSLPVVLGKFTGFEWVPRKFEQLLKPTIPILPRLTLTENSQIGLSSFAISTSVRMTDEDDCDVFQTGFVFFQDETRCIKFGYIHMIVDETQSDVLFVDTIVRARQNTPLIMSAKNPLAFVYVTEGGFLADQILDHSTGAWDYGSLIDLQLPVASHSNLASCVSAESYICFEDPDGNLRLVNLNKGVESMDHGRDLNMLPGTALAIKTWNSYRGSIGWRSIYNHLAIGFQDRNGRLMSLEGEKGENGYIDWNLSEIVAPSITEGIPFKPWTRSNCLISLRPVSPLQIEYAIFPDSSDQLVYHTCDKSGRLVRHSNPVCTIWKNSRYSYRDRALVYMSSDGKLECTHLHEDSRIAAKTRAIFQPHCRKRHHAQMRATLAMLKY